MHTYDVYTDTARHATAAGDGGSSEELSNIRFAMRQTLYSEQRFGSVFVAPQMSYGLLCNRAPNRIYFCITSFLGFIWIYRLFDFTVIKRQQQTKPNQIKSNQTKQTKQCVLVIVFLYLFSLIETHTKKNKIKRNLIRIVWWRMFACVCVRAMCVRACEVANYTKIH